MKLGLFGGSFDPPHKAHLALANQALNQFALDRVIWIPAAVSPFKSSYQPKASAAQRFEMVKAICQTNPKFEAGDFEIKEGGVSYSIDTLRYFQKRYPGAEFFWILGGDSIPGLSEWREAGTLKKEMIFLAAVRGEKMPAAPAGFRVQKLNLDWLPVSSTEIRSGLADGKGMEQLLPQTAEYIRANRLYGVKA